MESSILQQRQASLGYQRYHTDLTFPQILTSSASMPQALSPTLATLQRPQTMCSEIISSGLVPWPVPPLPPRSWVGLKTEPLPLPYPVSLPRPPTHPTSTLSISSIPCIFLEGQNAGVSLLRREQFPLKSCSWGGHIPTCFKQNKTKKLKIRSIKELITDGEMHRS